MGFCFFSRYRQAGAHARSGVQPRGGLQVRPLVLHQSLPQEEATDSRRSGVVRFSLFPYSPVFSSLFTPVFFHFPNHPCSHIHSNALIPMSCSYNYSFSHSLIRSHSLILRSCISIPILVPMFAIPFSHVSVPICTSIPISPMFLFPYFHSHSPMIWYWNRTMEQILEDSDAELRPGEEHLAALTAADRKSWAEMREKYFMTGVNRTSMEILEKVCGCGGSAKGERNGRGNVIIIPFL